MAEVESGWSALGPAAIVLALVGALGPTLLVATLIGHPSPRAAALLVVGAGLAGAVLIAGLVVAGIGTDESPLAGAGLGVLASLVMALGGWVSQRRRGTETSR